MMGKALPLRSDLSADALRAARRKRGGSWRGCWRSPMRWTAWGARKRHGWLAWTAKRLATRGSDTMPRGSFTTVGSPPAALAYLGRTGDPERGHSGTLERDGCVEWTLP